MLICWVGIATAQEGSPRPALKQPATLVGLCDGSPDKGQRKDRAEYYTYVLADAGLSPNGTSDNGTTPVTGSIGFRHLAANEEFRGFIGLKSATDTVHGKEPSDLARSLLVPSTTGGAGSLILSYRRYRCYGPSQQVGAIARLSVIRTTWAVDSVVPTTNNTLVVTGSPVTLVSASTGYSAVWINQADTTGNLLAFGTDVVLAFRGYAATNNSAAFRSRALGTTASSFWGPEFIAWIRFHDVSVQADLPYLSPLHGGRGASWTGWRGFMPIITFNLEASLYTIHNSFKQAAANAGLR
jgi:hypothetical protein